MSKKLSAAALFSIRISPGLGSEEGMSANSIWSGSHQSLTRQAFIRFRPLVLLCCHAGWKNRARILLDARLPRYTRCRSVYFLLRFWRLIVMPVSRQDGADSQIP